MSVLRVVVVGGGISGLAAAHALTKRGGAEVTLLERAPHLGGNIRTVEQDGFTIDGGPDSWVVTKPHASALARAVGLGDRLIPTVEATRRVYVYANGALHALPEGLVLAVPTEIMPIVKTGLFSWDAKLRMALEPLIPPRAWLGDEDESIGDFVARRLGDEVSDRLAAPMLGGIFAGDAREISVRVAFPQFVDAEKVHGSLIRSMRAMRRARAKAANADAAAKGEGAKAPSAFVSLKGGMRELVDAVASHLGTTRIRTSTSVRAIEAGDGSNGEARYRVLLEGGESLGADAVILTSPMYVSSTVVRGLDAPLADALAAFHYASTATVFMAFRREAIAHALDATGFIVPRSPKHEILAATWVSSKWEHRAPEGQVLLRVFFGGAGRESVLANDDAALTALGLAELRSIMTIHGEPLFTRVFRFTRASPQPNVGHLGRLRAVNERLALWPGLAIATNGLEGIGIPDCIRQAEAAVASIVRVGANRL